MLEHYVASAGLKLAKRDLTVAGNGGHYDLPPWGFGVVALTFLAFLPVFIYIGYTLKAIFPTLAMVEDANPPAYEPVALNEDVDGEPVGVSTSAAKPLSSSLRKLNRLLLDVGGWRANFRGIWCLVASLVATSFFGGIFAAMPLVPAFIGTLIASLALVQLNTAWVHIVISSPNALPFWKRLPPFRKTFEATCIPVFVFWAGTTVVGWVPWLVAGALGLPMWEPKNGSEIPEFEPNMAWKSLVVTIIVLAIMVLIVIPAQVVLVRVQASLLPPEEDPIVPFDRSFEGTVEPAIVGGKGYVSWRNALKTFPRTSWVRLYVLYFKVFLVSWATYILFGALVIPEIIMLSRKSEAVN